MTKAITPNPTRKVEKRILASLTLHPKHFEFMEPTNAEIALLKRDIKKRKLQNLIEITPDGVIIAGRKRWLALKKLNCREHSCLVRYDLATRGEIAIVEHLVMDNLARRQHSDLEVAVAYRALKAVYDKSEKVRGADMRDVLAEQFGMSGRSLDRLCQILDAPRSIQEAYMRREIRQVDAAKVTQLPAEVQDKICADIIARIPAQKAFNKHCGHSKKSLTSTGTKQSKPSMEAAVRSLTFATAEIKELAGVVTRLSPSHVAIVQRCTTEWLALLKKSRT
jgi:hypothetical protein